MRIAIFWIWILGTAAMPAQSAFEVASIKSWTSREIGGVHTYPGGRVTFRGCTLEYLIQQAFQVQQFQIAGGPGWMRSERFDIDAKPPLSSKSSHSMPPYSKAPMIPEERQMLQSLLLERFQLHYHRDTRAEGPVYLLVKGKRPLKMTDSNDKNEFPWSRVTPDGLAGINESMADLAWRLGEVLGRPVLDRTGIAGAFDFRVSYVAGATPDYVSITLATVQELGLKLEPSKGPAETIVIERAEKPSAN